MQQSTSSVGKNNLFLDRIKGKQFVLFSYNVTANLHFKEAFGEKEFPVWREDVVCGFRFTVVKTSCGGF